jgi:hypothetical protein
MTARRTSAKGRKGAGRPEAVVGRKPMLAAMTHHMSAAEAGARLDAVEKRAQRAARSATTALRHSMDEAVAAGKDVRISMKEMVAVVKRAARRMARQIVAAARAVSSVWKPAAKATVKTARRPARTSGRRAPA